jgi:hypothetical protein
MRKICPLDISSINERPVGMGFNFTTYKILEKKRIESLIKKLCMPVRVVPCLL